MCSFKLCIRRVFSFPDFKTIFKARHALRAEDTKTVLPLCGTALRYPSLSAPKCARVCVPACRRPFVFSAHSAVGAERTENETALHQGRARTGPRLRRGLSGLYPFQGKRTLPRPPRREMRSERLPPLLGRLRYLPMAAGGLSSAFTGHGLWQRGRM